MNFQDTEIYWRLREWLRKFWLTVKYRPFFVCPFCKGAGGEMSGYYEPEWQECYCYPHWEAWEHQGTEWPVGRVPLWVWLESKASIYCRMWYPVRFRDLIRCKLGIHHWIKDAPEPGEKLCCVCYEHKRSAPGGRP